VERVRENCKRGLSREEAVKEAIAYCIKNNVLKFFLQEHGSEVENMLLTEWNWDDALAVRWEEGREEGSEKGKKEQAGELLTLIEKGYSMEQLRSVLTLREAEPEYQ
jgi:SOS response regulatory protein OraA/RecX